MNLYNATITRTTIIAMDSLNFFNDHTCLHYYQNNFVSCHKNKNDEQLSESFFKTCVHSFNQDAFKMLNECQEASLQNNIPRFFLNDDDNCSSFFVQEFLYYDLCSPLSTDANDVVCDFMNANICDVPVQYKKFTRRYFGVLYLIFKYCWQEENDDDVKKEAHHHQAILQLKKLVFNTLNRDLVVIATTCDHCANRGTVQKLDSNRFMCVLIDVLMSVSKILSPANNKRLKTLLRLSKRMQKSFSLAERINRLRIAKYKEYKKENSPSYIEYDFYEDAEYLNNIACECHNQTLSYASNDDISDDELVFYDDIYDYEYDDDDLQTKKHNTMFLEYLLDNYFNEHLMCRKVILYWKYRIEPSRKCKRRDWWLSLM